MPASPTHVTRFTLAALTVIAVTALARTAHAECQVSETVVTVSVTDANGNTTTTSSVVTTVSCPTPGGPPPDPYDWYPLPGPNTEVQPEAPWYTIPDPPIPPDVKVVKLEQAGNRALSVLGTAACASYVEGRHLPNPPGHSAIEILNTLIARGKLVNEPFLYLPPDPVNNLPAESLCGVARVPTGDAGRGRDGTIILFDYFYSGYQDSCPYRPDNNEWRVMMLLHELGHLAYGDRHTESVTDSEIYNRGIREACGLTVPDYPGKFL